MITTKKKGDIWCEGGDFFEAIEDVCFDSFKGATDEQYLHDEWVAKIYAHGDMMPEIQTVLQTYGYDIEVIPNLLECADAIRDMVRSRKK